MPENKLVSITKMNVIGEDSRGSTAEIFLPRKQGEFILIIRKARSVSGNTYHEGQNIGTHPKIFILLTGDIDFTYRKIGTSERYSAHVQAPAIIEVSPYVTHKVDAITDFILLEGNSLKDIQNDRIREDV